MAKKMLIDATHAEETRVVVADGSKVEEFDFESVNKRQLAGNIYLAKVTRVEPSLQAAFVDYGGNRHGFLAFSEIHPDYYQIPVADRQALLEEERELARKADDEDAQEKPARGRRSRRKKPAGTAKAEKAASDADQVVTAEPSGDSIPGMDVVDLDDEDARAERIEGFATDEAQRDAEGDATGTADEDGDEGAKPDAAARDTDIESVASEDVEEEIQRPRKQRSRRYKIQEVIKVRQILLVQVVKEERGNKGAALTTYLSLAGRYCVLMPNTARGGGISRKITNAADRKKLKDIANGIEIPQGAGLIIRTAGAKRTKAEIKRDYEYLQRLWEQIRELTLKSVAPAPIYEEGNLIKRSIRDLYNREIDEVFVEGEAGYRLAKDFMKMLMPSHAKNVKHYTDPLPLFARYQVESYLSAMFNPTVQLKSGGYIVIGVTEALVAIDVNSGRATKEGSIEETALKTNLEAAEEVARQLRLRDLAGLIVIDFIDMDERKNNAAVEKRMKEKLKTDRARIQVGRISGFGLMEMSRQRLRPGMIEATTAPCPHCHGTGLIRNDESMALSILRQLEEEGVRKRTREVLVKAPVGIANFLMNQKREHIAFIESRYGLSVRIEADPALVSPDHTIERFKTATRAVPEVTAPVVSVDSKLLEETDEAIAAADAQIEAEIEAEAAENAGGSESGAGGESGGTGDGDGDGGPRKKRRRRRRRGGRGRNGGGDSGQDDANEAVDDAGDGAAAAEESADAPATAPVEAEAEAPKPARKRSRRKRADTPEAQPEQAGEDQPQDAASAPEAAPEPEAEPEAEAEPKKPAPRKRSRAKPKPKDAAPAPEAETEAKPEPAPEPAEAAAAEPQPEPPAEAAEPAVAPEPAMAGESAAEEGEADKAKPKTTRRRGWWALNR
ncbi:ribonuclease [Maritimibacter sp. 55A14]|uniref:Rne/Rng family ribonuclease n=1 Tax=Maritimibacter sp. 55A14 TaxID=2174844 RepID=UPI000D616233|nr:ribonuclease E/G [Maritimibacter sp. 55A14]PWE30456.1 ribonuclease [Maritimibacter sp. 55A14]